MGAAHKRLLEDFSRLSDARGKAHVKELEVIVEEYISTHGDPGNILNGDDVRQLLGDLKDEMCTTATKEFQSAFALAIALAQHLCRAAEEHGAQLLIDVSKLDSQSALSEAAQLRHAATDAPSLTRQNLEPVFEASKMSTLLQRRLAEDDAKMTQLQQLQETNARLKQTQAESQEHAAMTGTRQAQEIEDLRSKLQDMTRAAEEADAMGPVDKIQGSKLNDVPVVKQLMKMLQQKSQEARDLRVKLAKYEQDTIVDADF